MGNISDKNRNVQSWSLEYPISGPSKYNNWSHYLPQTEFSLEGECVYMWTNWKIRDHQGQLLKILLLIWLLWMLAKFSSSCHQSELQQYKEHSSETLFKNVQYKCYQEKYLVKNISWFLFIFLILSSKKYPMSTFISKMWKARFKSMIPFNVHS